MTFNTTESAIFQFLNLNLFIFLSAYESEFGKPNASKNSVGDPLKTVWLFCYLFMNK